MITARGMPVVNFSDGCISISAISFFSLVQAEKAIKSDKKAVSVFRARIYKKLTSCRHHREPKM
jgi:hypothetical protein